MISCSRSRNRESSKKSAIVIPKPSQIFLMVEGDELINAVITAALWSEERKPGNWQKMTAALRQGAAKTEQGTVNAFLFRAMVDRLLEEFHGLGGAPAE